jgi:hypothetical protein
VLVGRCLGFSFVDLLVVGGNGAIPEDCMVWLQGKRGGRKKMIANPDLNRPSIEELEIAWRKDAYECRDCVQLGDGCERYNTKAPQFPEAPLPDKHPGFTCCGGYILES